MRAAALCERIARRRHDVVVEARAWLDTPYHHLADVRGAGVDCAMLLVRVYEHCGLIPPDVDPRPYAHDWHLHRGEERYLGWLRQYAVEQHGGEPAPGDVVVWRFGRCFSHGAIVVGEGPRAAIVHALRSSGRVVLSTLDDPELQHQPSKRFRLVQLGGHAGGHS